MNIFELVKNEKLRARVAKAALWVGLAHATTLHVFAVIVFVSPSSVGGRRTRAGHAQRVHVATCCTGSAIMKSAPKRMPDAHRDRARSYSDAWRPEWQPDCDYEPTGDEPEWDTTSIAQALHFALDDGDALRAHPPLPKHSEVIVRQAIGAALVKVPWLNISQMADLIDAVTKSVVDALAEVQS